MNARDNGENWVVIGPSHVELGPQVPAMVANQSLTLQYDLTKQCKLIQQVMLIANSTILG